MGYLNVICKLHHPVLPVPPVLSNISFSVWTFLFLCKQQMAAGQARPVRHQGKFQQIEVRQNLPKCPPPPSPYPLWQNIGNIKVKNSETFGETM